LRRILLAVLLFAAWSPASAQTNFHNVEPNQTKEQATPALGMVAGDGLSLPQPGLPPPNIFHVRTAPLPAGVYRHRLTQAPFSWVGNYPAILGRTQWHHTIDPSSTTVVQQSTLSTSPGNFLQWYGFGQAEDLFLDMGSFSRSFGTTYRLETQPVAPVVFTVPYSYISFSLHSPAGGAVDADLALYDASFDALPGFGTRYPSQCSGGLLPGTYYLAVSGGPLHNHLEANPADVYHSDSVLDFRGAVVSGSTNVGQSYTLNLGTGTSLPITFTESFQVHWFQFDIGSSQYSASFCPGDGTAGTCACGASPLGQGVGCANSTGRGARLFAYDQSQLDVSFAIEDVPAFSSVLVFAGLTIAPGTPVYGGNLCLGPGAIRLPVTQADATGRCVARSGAAFPIAGFGPGTTVHAQAAYRDAIQPGACVVNVTNGESLTLR
jgi:hypothetical protein